MADALDAFLDDTASATVRELQGRCGPVDDRLRVTFARAGSIPRRTRDRLCAELSLLTLPELWLATLGSTPGAQGSLVLAAIVDPELLALHSAVHDVLAGAVRAPSAYHLPGWWVPHCVLAGGVDDTALAAGFAALHPVVPVRARIIAIGVTDTRTGDVELLLTAGRP